MATSAGPISGGGRSGLIPISELEKRFTYHPPKGDQAERYEGLRRMGYTLAVLICELSPESRERSLALTKLEEAIMWANAGIARNE